ncbi:MAG TPA: matrixin family metalloprotease [Thermoanaerobaculia bacterium]|nr:matrixin family metalloprotease [Thermoanaerobaculia bacterium]
MKRRTVKRYGRLALTAVALLAALAPMTVQAGGALESLDLTAGTPGPIPGTEVAGVVPLRWDDRCLPPPHRLDANVDPIPNPLGADTLTVADAAAVVTAAMDRWTAIDTSYAALDLAGTAMEPDLAGYDTVNEITFVTDPDFGFLASSPSIVLLEDSVLTDGLDLDGDGDSDVSAALTTCADTDGDGDFERPAGFYRAGTILDNDVLLNSREFRFTTGDAALDTNPRSVDLEAVLAHELGHSLGLAHAANNQKSDGDGEAATLFPFTDTGDPDAERAQRSLDSDDRAFASLFYPEGTPGDGSLPGGPATLGPGDVAFADAYALLTGEVVSGETRLPVAGAVVEARGNAGGELFATAYSGRVRLLVDGDGEPLLINDPTFHVLGGDWVLPVEQGAWRLRIEPVDGDPVPSTVVNFTVRVGALFGQQDFLEEGWSGADEAATERLPGMAQPVPAVVGQVRGGHRFVTGTEVLDTPFGSRDNEGIRGFPGLWYAVRFPVDEVLARFDDGALLVAALYRTLVVDTSVVPEFATAALVGGRLVGGTPQVDLANPLVSAMPFVAQDNDFSPLYFGQPEALRARIETSVAQGEYDQLFVVLRAPLTTPFPGPNGVAPLVGFDGDPTGNDVPIFDRSYLSLNGVDFFLDDRFNYMFALVYGEE